MSGTSSSVVTNDMDSSRKTFFFTHSSTNLLNCSLFNAQSVANKLLELQYIMYNSDYDCIFITESWLHDGIHDGAVDPRGLYTVIGRTV